MPSRTSAPGSCATTPLLARVPEIALLPRTPPALGRPGAPPRLSTATRRSSLFLLYDTSKVVAEAKREPDEAGGARPFDPINHALNLYTDLVQVPPRP